MQSRTQTVCKGQIGFTFIIKHKDYTLAHYPLIKSLSLSLVNCNLFLPFYEILTYIAGHEAKPTTCICNLQHFSKWFHNYILFLHVEVCLLI